MVVALFVDDLFRSPQFGKEVLARDYRLLTQIARPVEDLVDVEVHLEQAAQEGAEAPEERLPEGVFLDTLFARVEVVVLAGVILKWHHWLLINNLDG